MTTSLLLVASGIAHVRPGAALHADLAAHRILPWATTASVALPAAELVLGTFALVALAGRLHVLLVATLVAQAATFTAFAGYLTIVVRAGRGGLPCGCGLPDVPVGPGAIGRAAALALVAAAAALEVARSGSSSTGAPSLGDVALVTVAGATLALLAAVVQPARQLPVPVRAPGAAS